MYALFFDILGFSNLVKTVSPIEQERIQKILQTENIKLRFKEHNIHELSLDDTSKNLLNIYTTFQIVSDDLFDNLILDTNTFFKIIKFSEIII